MVQKIRCLTCGVLFTPRTSGGKPQVRCSEKCRRKVANANFIKKNAPVRAANCAECGGPIVQASLGRPRRFCSDECKARVTNRAQNRRRLPAPKQPDRECAHCGKVFTPRRKDQVYCPGWCGQAAYKARKAAGEPMRQVEQVKICQECGQEFTTRSPVAKWCSALCRIRDNGRAAARRRGDGAGAVPYIDREIFERDGWRCYLCGKPVKHTTARTNPAGATIDHIVPLSRGGTDSPDNVATAHWRCNRKKHARPADFQPRLL